MNPQQAAPAATPQRAPGSVSALRASIRVISDTPDSTLGRSYAAALRWAGVEVVAAMKDADVVTELRRQTHHGGDGGWWEVTLTVTGGGKHLATAQVRQPAQESLTKENLASLTTALTQSASVRDYADQVALQKAGAARAADETAWQNAGAEECASSREFSDCVEVIRYLNGFPRGEHRSQAEVALQNAEKVRMRAARDAAIERVKADITAWQVASPESCRTAAAHDACEGVAAYLTTYPHGRYAVEARQLLASSEVALDGVRQQSELKGQLSRQRAEATTARR